MLVIWSIKNVGVGWGGVGVVSKKIFFGPPKLGPNTLEVKTDLIYNE